jgi:beta-lactamase class A
LRKKCPGGDTTVTLGEILRYTVSLSDNNGCDILFRLIGGPSVVNEYVHGLGIADMAIVATEEEMHAASGVQFNNWSSPVAMAQLLEAFHTGGILSEESREYLWSLMVGAVTGRGRLKSNLPEGTTVAHKSGSSGTNDKGIAAATNDVGLIALPDGREVIVVVFVSNSTANEETRDEVIANVGRAVWEAYAGQ